MGVRLSGASFYRDVPATQIAAGAVALGPIYLTDGLQGAPALAFVGDTDTGIWRDGTGIRIGRDNALRLTVGAEVTSAVVLVAPDGSAAAPGFRFAGAPATTGLYGAGAAPASVRASVDGVNRWICSQNDVIAISAGQLARGRLGIEQEAVKTANYQITDTDAVLAFDGLLLTGTLPAVPGFAQGIFIRNQHAASPLTIARNGNNINGAAADLVVLAQTAVFLSWFASSIWYSF